MNAIDQPPRHALRDFFKFHFLTRLVSVQPDRAVHKVKLVRGLASTTIYAVAYGIYEYFIVYQGKGDMWDVFGETTNWAIMIAGLVITVLASTRANVELCIVSLLYIFLLEDLVYWLGQWGVMGICPFPIEKNWFDSYFASFRVLGGIGRAIPFWPHVPFFYLPGYGAIVAYYIASWRSAKAGRFVAWIIGPLFIAIVAGTLVSEETATWLLITIPSALFSLVTIAIAVKWHDTRA